MKAFNFFKIDVIRCKMQLLLGFGFMVVFGLFFSFSAESIYMAAGYLFFVAVMFAGQPFNVESQCEAGFIDMIPGTRKERLIGRYLYGFTCLLCAGILGLLLLLIYSIQIGNPSEYTGCIAMVLVGVAFLMTGLQYIGLVIAGKGKSQQFIALIQMAPSFILFFGGMLVEKIVDKFHFIDVNTIIEHRTILSSLVLMLGILMLALSFLICSRIMEKRDYA